MIRANYHTHTIRCGHAVGSEREYIEAAIAAGLTTLGFSDHVPMPYPYPLVSSIRMSIDELPDYVDTLTALREEYADRIEILIGFETEYIPRYHDALIDALSHYPIDYMIQGQHFVDDEFDGFYAGTPTGSERDLADYVRLTVRGMETGVFSYLAHPDLINFSGSAAVYRKHMREICECSLELDIPLEINMLGFETGRNYPCDAFWGIAGEMGCRIIMGCDAHNPKNIRQPEDVPGLTDFISYNSLSYSQELTLRPIL